MAWLLRSLLQFPRPKKSDRLRLRLRLPKSTDRSVYRALVWACCSRGAIFFALRGVCSFISGSCPVGLRVVEHIVPDSSGETSFSMATAAYNVHVAREHSDGRHTSFSEPAPAGALSWRQRVGPTPTMFGAVRDRPKRGPRAPTVSRLCVLRRLRTRTAVTGPSYVKACT